MKNLYLLFVLFMTGLMLTSAAVSDDQELAMLQEQGQADLSEVLKEIKESTGFNLIYDPALVDHLKIDIEVIDPELTDEERLDYILRQVNLDFKELKKGTYAIVKRQRVQQSQVVRGKVTSSEDGEPIPGVTILLKGSTEGAITDFDGNYSIQVPSPESVLIFSFIGFNPQEVAVGKATILNISLDPNVKELSEVVITAIGLEEDKRELGYSIQNVDSDDILRSREANISSALSSKAAGVQVISASGSPGAAATVRIRGNRSASGGNEPLYVIDGVPISNNTSGNGIIGVDVSNRAIDINPNDIEKITVLKGPSATVLYGSRAANGVIMINTKKGKVGSPTVTLSSSYGISEVSKLPPKQYQYAQGSPAQGEWVYRGPHTGESNTWGPLISDLEFDGDTSYLYDRRGRLVPKGEGNGMPAMAYDDYDAFWVKGQMIDNNISVNGGNEAVRYYFSIGNLYQTGIVPSADFERTSVKSNIDARITDKLGAGISATYVHSGGSRAQRGSNLSGVTTGVFRNPATFDIGNGKKGEAAADDPLTYSFPDGDQRSYRGNGLYDNPFWSINRNPYTDNVNRVMGNVNLNYEVFDWLRLSYKLGIDQYTDRRKQAWDINSSSEPLGKVIQSTVFSDIVNSDFLILVNKNFGDFGVDATLGHNYYQSSSFSRETEGSVMAVPGFYNISNTQDLLSSESYGGRQKFYGAFADVRLNFREYLFLSLSGRNDWSSTLPEQNNSFFYPAASFGFEFTEPLGLSDSRVFPYGKLRVSYGKVGGSAPSFRTSTYYTNANIDGDGLLSANEFPAFGINAFERSGLMANNELTHELTTTIEVGGDLQFFDSRVGVDLTYYKAFTFNQIVTTTISATTGFTDLTLNSGDTENKGIELVLNTAPIRNQNFEWDLDVNFTRNRSVIKSLPEDIESITLAEFTAISSMNIVGEPYGTFVGTNYRRKESGQLIIGSDGWPLLNDSQEIIGDPNPDWIAGVKNSLSAYGFQFTMLWDIKKGGDVWNGTKAVMDYLGTSKESGDDREVTGYVYDGVTVDGEPNTVPVDFANPSKGLSGIKWRRAGTLLGVAEDNIEDGSWVRLREVTLSYGLPKSLLSKTKSFQAVNVSVYGRNLLLFTGYKGVDPETNLRGPSNAQGWDYFNLPGTKSYGVALNLVLK